MKTTKKQKEGMHQCDNCGSIYTDSSVSGLASIPDLAERLDPGGVVPSGECECGALVYPGEKPKPSVMIVVRGGCVQEVTTASVDMDIYIVDHDNMDYDNPECDRLTAIAEAGMPQKPDCIRDVEAAVEEELSDYCRQCGAGTDDGEGYDGLCGNCADKKESNETKP